MVIPLISDPPSSIEPLGPASFQIPSRLSESAYLFERGCLRKVAVRALADFSHLV
jgi:hypothetical protein